MSTIFDLNTGGELPAVNQGMSDYHYAQQAPTRGISAATFEKGPIEFKYHVAGNQYYVPARSYIRARIRISKNGGAQLTQSDALAPAMNIMGNLFSSGAILLHNKEISKIDSFMGEIDMLETRMGKSGAWMDGIGRTVRWLGAELDDRIQDISVDGTEKNETTTLRLELGFDAATTIEFATPANTATVLVADPTFVGKFVPGDIIVSAAVNSYIVLSVVDNVLNLGGPVAAEGAAAVAFSRLRTSQNNRKPRRVHGFEVTWVPPFSLNKLGHAMPVGDYKLRLVPHSGTNYKVRAIESVVNKIPNTDFEIEVDSIFYYVATMKGPRVEDKTYFLDLDETHGDSEVFTTSNAQQKTFSVSENTYALTVAFASSATGSDTRFPPSKFIAGGNYERSLNRLQVEYADQTKPNPQADPEFFLGTNNNDFLEQRYVDTYLYNGLHFDDAGPETKDQWLTRGPYYYLPFPKDASSKDTRVVVRFGFDDTIPADDAKVLLFSHSKKMATIKIVGGKVESVNLIDR